nr:Rieske (2Fe-2S) protein [Verrucomicrobiota bacterium]
MTQPLVRPIFRKTTDTFTAGATTLAQRYFVSPEVFGEERTAIFSKQWICVAHQSQLSSAGDYLVVEVAGESLIVARPPSPGYSECIREQGGAAGDQKEIIRAFYNVCRHRGTRLCENATGHAAAIQCPYHAWTYALDGRLIGAPHMDEAAGFEKSNYSLGAVHLGIWEGFIFVNLAENPAPLEEV